MARKLVQKDDVNVGDHLRDESGVYIVETDWQRDGIGCEFVTIRYQGDKKSLQNFNPSLYFHELENYVGMSNEEMMQWQLER